MMKLLIYASDGKQRRRLLQAIDACLAQLDLETVAEIETLNRRLRRFQMADGWMILVAGSSAELDCLTAMGDLIHPLKIILVLPDQRRATVAAGHSLYPRFISFLNSDFEEIGSVMGRVIGNQTQQRIVQA